ncbi:MAG: hypothetical protein A3I09_01730 [Deltaproteobacteria bacterium RIFCSPLOWO2_02_FULL_47_10]|nr:MAG: hypothetical protein A3I09_01730 [Deltaproteobacteria bacterium RIFCSPLOWO2_02_FULL_47_10]
MRKRVGIFGGSFNPPHKGHIEICRYLLNHNDVDEVWVVPCFKHPFGKELAPFNDRLTMCKFAFGGFEKSVRVSDIERTLGDISHTVKTLERLLQDYHDYKFFLIVGGDTTEESVMWHDAEKIRQLVQFITLPRGSESMIPDISSTNVREAIRHGRKFSDFVTREVAVYIVTHGLYH